MQRAADTGLFAQNAFHSHTSQYGSMTRSARVMDIDLKARLLQQAEIYDVDEFVCVTITYDFAARKRSYELLAEAFGLKLQAAA